MTVAQRTNTALGRYLTGRTIAKIQKTRDEILNTTIDDVKKAATILRKFQECGSVCVYGGEDKINANSQIFNQIYKLTK